MIKVSRQYILYSFITISVNIQFISWFIPIIPHIFHEDLEKICVLSLVERKIFHWILQFKMVLFEGCDKRGFLSRNSRSFLNLFNTGTYCRVTASLYVLCCCLFLIKYSSICSIQILPYQGAAVRFCLFLLLYLC